MLILGSNRVSQSMGEWSVEEYELFVSIVEKYGAGDRWGKISTFIFICR